jgi:nitroreductase
MAVRNWALAQAGSRQCSERIDMGRQSLSSVCAGDAVVEAVEGRRSIRHFLPTPVPDELVLRILSAATRAPSGQNMQPWHIHFVTGESRIRLCEATLEAAERGERSDEYAYFPRAIQEPYIGRRRKVGFDLFALHGVDRRDLAGRQRVHCSISISLARLLGCFSRWSAIGGLAPGLIWA